MPLNPVIDHGRFGRKTIRRSAPPMVLSLLMLFSPGLVANDAPDSGMRPSPLIAAAQEKAAQAEQEQRRLEEKNRRLEQESKRQAEQATEKARQAEAERQRLQQEVDRLLGEKINLKVDPTARQRAQQLEQQIVELQRQAEAAKAAKQLAEEQLAKEKLKAERAEAVKRRLEVELKQSVGTGHAPHSEPLNPSNVTDRVDILPSKMTGATAAPAVGSTIQDCEVCPKLVVIPPGQFTMGSPADEKERALDEGPQHTVRIGYTLAVGKYEVTFAEWDACVAAGGCAYKPDDSGWGRGKRPVINVSWDDIHQQYLPWLNRKTNLADRPVNQQYRLLTEAEWEYAARAGTTTAFSFGDFITTDQANYDGNYSYNGSPKGQNRQQTVPVDSVAFAPNAWGLYHVHGNVWEWVEDCYKDSYVGAPGDGSAMQETGCSRRVLRGCSWGVDPGFLRSANRSGIMPDGRGDDVGFRLARMLP